jgi:DNA-binding CsgD family transcriptional regulator
VGLFEREAELARIDRLLDRTGRGVGAVLVVQGVAGIGKTALLTEVRERADELGFGLLTARGSEFESEMAFGVACQLLEPMLRSASASERRKLLAGVARIGAGVLGVQAEPATRSRTAAQEPPVDRFAAIHGLYWLCANRAERGPIVVTVDDVQWADDPSLAWLGYLGHRARDLALLLVVGFRPGDAGADRPELARLLTDDEVSRIDLRPLTATGIGAIVRTQLDEAADDRFCAACGELTGGNPMFMRELLAAVRSEGLPASGASVESLSLIAPAAIGTSVLARLGRMGPEAVALARALAVLGTGSEVRLAARLAELDPVVAELTADRLAAAQILAPERPLEFFHPLIGAAVREDIAPGARRVAHRRAAALVDAEEGPPGRVASHLLACAPGADVWVVDRLEDAARRALEQGAPGVAASYLRRALTEPPDRVRAAALLLALGTAEWRVGHPDAIEHLEQSRGAVAGDQNTLVAASTLLAVAYLVTDRGVGRSVQALDRVRAATRDANPQLALNFEAAIALVGMMNDRTAPEAFRRAAELDARLDDVADPPLYLIVMLSNYAARAGRADEAQRLVERALAYEPYPPPLDIALALISPLTLIENYDLQQQLCEDLLTDARRRGALQEMIGICALRASASTNRGALADAEADARWALERAEGMYRIQAIGELIRLLVERDALPEAEQQLAQVPDPGASRSVEAARLLMARGVLRVAQGRLAEALGDLLECGQRCEQLGLNALNGAPWRSEAAIVQAALGDGDGDGALRLADEQLELARAFGRPRILGVSLRACGLVRGGEPGLELLREAVQTLEGAQAPVELARALTDLGAALRRAGRRADARPELERGLDLAHHCGAVRIASQARAELVIAGAKPRRDAITGRDALTASELRVARLAGDGLTNREIAQSLFITTKTASTHLSHIYRKLGITRRDQLDDALNRGLHATEDPAPVRAATIS